MEKRVLVLALLALGFASGAHAAGARSLHQQPDLLAAAGNVLQGANGVLQGVGADIRAGLSTLVTDLFGPQNSFFTQIPQDIQQLSWSNLQNLEIGTPVESFFDSIKNGSLPSLIVEKVEKIHELLDDSCTPAKYTPSASVPSNCVGKEILVRLAPWKCSLYQNGTVGCSPPFIEVVKKAAVCTAAYTSAATYKGRECKLEKDIGKNYTKTVGGQAFAVDISKSLLDIPHSISTSLLPNAIDATGKLLKEVATGGK